MQRNSLSGRELRKHFFNQHNKAWPHYSASMNSMLLVYWHCCYGTCSLRGWIIDQLFKNTRVHRICLVFPQYIPIFSILKIIMLIITWTKHWKKLFFPLYSCSPNSRWELQSCLFLPWSPLWFMGISICKETA